MKLVNKMDSAMSKVWVDDEKNYYANEYYGFYCKTPLVEGEPKLLFYHQKYLDFVKPDVSSDTLIIKEANETTMYQVHDEKKTLYKNDDLLKQSEIKQLESYQMVRDLSNNYTFTENSTGKVIKFGKDRHRLVTERQGYFYFRKDKKPKQLLRLNDNFETLESYDLEGQGASSIKVKDQYAFYGYKGTPHYLEVFDLDKFTPVSPKVQVEDPNVRVYKISELYYIRCGGSLFIWNGSSLIRHDFGHNKRVWDILAKKDYLYVAFEQDPYLYAYQAGTLKLLKKQRITSDAYQPLSLYNFDSHTQCDVILNESGKINQLNYTTAWADEDFFSDEAFEVVMEAPIHTESQIADGELFSVQLTIDASQPLEKVIRQSISIAKDAINRHGDMGLDSIEFDEDSDDTFSVTGKYFSPRFNGRIHICYQNSQFTKARQKQFEQAIEGLNDMYGLFDGYALGKLEPLELTVSFE